MCLFLADNWWHQCIKRIKFKKLHAHICYKKRKSFFLATNHSNTRIPNLFRPTYFVCLQFHMNRLIYTTCQFHFSFDITFYTKLHYILHLAITLTVELKIIWFAIFLWTSKLRNRAGLLRICFNYKTQNVRTLTILPYINSL